ncbi:hypothetical protein SKAU_G00062020 [Synaphobranchus kaupii]|uniref:Uncharacterized protein n=1 Tax=Synaphobranchus kaupii TaxID=118154 RepID=A0A9Q1G532_SYNKA|nr:hypothetical protein SKAU_G00062020 [Synaphobranchus kaupii]
MGNEEWMSRLRTFAALGVWPSEAGNRPAPRQKKCDTTTRTLILFSITRSNIWTDSNTFQAHFDVGIAQPQPFLSPPPSQPPSLLLQLLLPLEHTPSPQQHHSNNCCHHQLSLRPSSPHHPPSHCYNCSSTPSMTPAAPEQQLAVDERSVPGMDRVDSLAEYLVGLRTETAQTLNNQQASTIIALWQNLLPYDQQRVAYAARHQVRLTTGRFRCSKKKPVFTPGVESMTRCVLGSTGSPAQWPNSCRLVESIFVKLCDIHKSHKKQGNYALTRWTLILRDYSKIRQLVLGNGTVMQSTTLQLFDVNQNNTYSLAQQATEEAVFCCKGTTCLPLFLLLLRLSHLYWYAPLLHHPSPAPNISTTCLEVLQDRQWSRGSLQLWPNIPILHRLSARGCKLRGSCSLSRHLHLHLPLCLLSPTPPLSLAHLCF